MLTIKIRLRCPHDRVEVLPTELELAECMVEDLVSRAMLELFGEVIVEKVEISLLEEERHPVATLPEASSQ